MWELPARVMSAWASAGWSVVEDLLGAAEGGVEGGLVGGGEGGQCRWRRRLASTLGSRSLRGVGSAGRRLAAVMALLRGCRRGWGGRIAPSWVGGWVRCAGVTPEKVLSSTVWRSLTATRILSPGWAGSKRTMGSRSSPSATRRPLK